MSGAHRNSDDDHHRPIAPGRGLVLAAVTATIVGGATTAQSAGGRPTPAKMTVSPTSVTAGLADNLAFKFQATSAFTSADVTVVIPSGWTPPVLGSPSANGYVSVQAGTCSIPSPATGITGAGSWTITVHGVTCATNKTFTVSYSKAAFGLPGSSSTFNSTVAGIALDPAVMKVNVGAAAKLAFTQAPAGGTGGTAFAAQPSVAVQDIAGNVVTGNRSNVTLSLAGGTPGALLTCAANPKAAVNGIAAFTTCKIDKVGTAYHLHAVDGTLTPADSTPFNVNSGPGASLVFTQQPGGASTSGAALPTQPVVTLRDAGGNTATGDTSVVNLGITSGTPTSGGGALSGCSQSTSSGVVTFSGCAITGAGTGYKLHATATGMTAADSIAFNVAAPVATKLAFTRQPGGAITGGVPFPVQPQVTIQDGSNNPVTGNTSTVTLSIGGGSVTGAPATLSGCTQSVSAGVVTFSGCRIDLTGTYVLHAADEPLTPTDSGNVSIGAGPAAHLSLALSSASMTADDGSVAAIATVTDAGGNPVQGEPVLISTDSLAASPGPTHDNLNGTYSTAISSRTVGSYHVTAADPPTPLSDTKLLGVSAGAPSDIDFSLVPSSVSADTGTSLATVTVDDAWGNPVKAASVAISTADSDASVGSVTNNQDGTYTADVTSRVAGTHDIDATVNASSAGTQTLTVAPGSPHSISLALDPSTIPSGDSSTAQITVVDAYGNAVSDATVTITGSGFTAGDVSNDGEGSYSALLSSSVVGTHDVTAQAGTASDIKTLTVDPAAPAAITLSLSSVTVSADVGLVTATATVTDGHGHPLTGQSVTITSGNSSVGTVTGNPDGTYSATVGSSVAGGHTFTATLGSLTDSQLLTVTPGAPAQLVFSVQPAAVPDWCAPATYDVSLCLSQLLFGPVVSSTITAGNAFDHQPHVMVKDNSGNVVTDAASLIDLAITPTTGASGAALDCDDGSINAVAGVATFSGCHVDKAGTGYTLRATSDSLQSADSATFDIVPAAPAAIVLGLDHTTISAGGTATATATLTDAYGNGIPGQPVSISSTDVHVEVGTTTPQGGGVYKASVTSTTVGAHTIDATLGTLTDSATLTVTPGAAHHMVFLQQPAGTPDWCAINYWTVECLFQSIGVIPPPGTISVGTPFGVQPQVAVVDAAGNVVTDDASPIYLNITIDTGTSGAQLSCTASPVIAVHGVATFAGCAIDTIGSDYRLRAGSDLFAPVDSEAFAVVAGPPSDLSVSLSDPFIVAGDSSTVTITILDAFGNPLSGLSPYLSLDEVDVTAPTDNGDGTYTGSVTSTQAGPHNVKSGVTVGLVGTYDEETLTVLAGVPATMAPYDGNGEGTGDDQIKQVNQQFAQPLVVRILDAYDNPVPDVEVDFACLSDLEADDPCAAVDAHASTNEYGVAYTYATANANVGGYTVRATAGDPTMTSDFHLTNVAATLVVLSGDHQTAVAGQPFPDDIVVQLLDVTGQPVDGSSIVFGSNIRFLHDNPFVDADGIVHNTAWAVQDGGAPSPLGDVQVQLEGWIDGAVAVTTTLHFTVLES